MNYKIMHKNKIIALADENGINDVALIEGDFLSLCFKIIQAASFE